MYYLAINYGPCELSSSFSPVFCQHLPFIVFVLFLISLRLSLKMIHAKVEMSAVERFLPKMVANDLCEDLK